MAYAFEQTVVLGGHAVMFKETLLTVFFYDELQL